MLQRAGLAPTGILANAAKALGFASVDALLKVNPEAAQITQAAAKGAKQPDATPPADQVCCSAMASNLHQHTVSLYVEPSSYAAPLTYHGSLSRTLKQAQDMLKLLMVHSWLDLCNLCKSMHLVMHAFAGL